MEEFDLVYWIRVVNAILSASVVGLCLIKASWSHLRNARDARVAGLGLLCLAITWGSAARRNEEFEPRILVLTIGLLLCCYGMAKIAKGEAPEPKRYPYEVERKF